jgi:VCBS repeat-containing protein
VKTAELEITTSDGPFTVALNGHGTVPPPVAVPDSYSVAEDSALNVPAPGVRANDTNASGASLAAVQVSGPSNGALTLNADGSFSYTPAPDFSGSDSFTYKITGGVADSNVATVSLTVSSAGDAPVAIDGSLTTNEDTAASGVLSASDPDDQAVTFSIVGNGTKGLASITNPATGAYSYVPDPNANGSDSFTFKASDGSLESNIATVTVTIQSVNDPPLASSGTLSAIEDVSAAGTLSVSDPDGDTVTYTIIGNGLKGKVTISNPVTGAFVYTPFRNATGTDTFTFAATDGVLQSNVASVTVTIVPMNDVPVAHGLSFTMLEDTGKNLALAGLDADGDALAFTIVSQPSHGALTGVGPDVTYTPTLNFNGLDSFTFRVTDQHSNSNVATVTISVRPEIWAESSALSGPVTAIAVHPLFPLVVYAGVVDVELERNRRSARDIRRRRPQHAVDTLREHTRRRLQEYRWGSLLDSSIEFA